MNIIKTNDINLNSLQFFREVYQCKSMTKAAEKLFSTQSGVSQRISKLELDLKIKLFDRVNGSLVPTEEAHELYKTVTKTFGEIEKTLEKFNSGFDISSKMTGTIRIGIPIEFGNRYILPFISKFSKLYPLVKFEIKYGHVIHFKEHLLHNRLDLAVVDEYKLGNEFNKKELAYEVLTLCGAQEFSTPLNKQKLEKMLSLPLLDYDEGAVLLRQWFKHHFKTHSIKINLKAHAMDVHGLANLIELGMGIGVLPKEKALERGLFIFKEERLQLINHISVAKMKKNNSKLVQLFFNQIIATKFLIDRKS